MVKNCMAVRVAHLLFACLCGISLAGVICGQASASNAVYIAQSQAGTGDGLSCANAKAYTYFNTSGNWSATPTGIQIGPATTVHICGVLTPSQATAALTFQGNGASGSPVTLLFETGARIDGTPYCGTSGCINLNGKNYLLIDGGTACGKVNGATSSTVACNGVIRNMLAGSAGQTCPGGACSSVLSGSTITALILADSGAPTGIEIRNLQLGPSYIRALNAVAEGQATRGVEFYHAFPTSIHIHHNVFLSTAKQAQVDGQDNITGTWNGYEYDHNDFSDQCWAIGAGSNTTLAGSGSSITGILVHDNEISNWTKWVANDPNNCHGNGTMFFNYYNNTDSGGTRTVGDSTSLVYNNYIHGDLSGGTVNSSPSGLLSCQDNCVNINFFNNLVLDQCPGGSIACAGTFYFNGPGGGGEKVYNNTVVCTANSSPIVGPSSPTMATMPIVAKNNIFSGCSQLAGIRSNCPTCLTSNNNDGYGLTGDWVSYNTGGSGVYLTLAQWQSSYSQDLNSITTNPNLSTSYAPNAGSPVIGLGTNLTSLGISALTTDLAGIARPGSGSWDAGVYQYSSILPKTVLGGGGAGSTVIGAVNSAAPIPVGYTGTDVIQWGAVPNVGGATRTTSIFYDASFPVGFRPRIIRCTDRSSVPGQPNTSLSQGLGGTGQGVLSNANDTIWHATTGTGADVMIVFNPATMTCANHVITKDLDADNPGSANSFKSFGGGSFDLTNPAYWYSSGGGSDESFTSTQVARYEFLNFTTGQYRVPTMPVIDFAFGQPNASNTPAWTNGHTYSFGDYVAYTYSAPDWQANTTYVIGDIIKPLTGNSAGCAFKAVKPGPSSGTQPTWGTSCNTNTKTDGSVTGMWRGLAGDAVFVYQVLTAAGTVGSTCTSRTTGTPVFAGPDGHPDQGMTVVDGGSGTCSYINTGVALPQANAETWNAWAGMSRDSTRAGLAGSSATYGNFADGWATGKNANDATMTAGQPTLTATAGFAAGDCASPNPGCTGTTNKAIYVRGAGASGKMLASTIVGYTNATTVILADNAVTTVTGQQVTTNLNYVKYTGGQDSGNRNQIYDGSLNRFYLFDTVSGINSQYTCSLGAAGGWNCSGGTWNFAARGRVTGCQFNIHNFKMAAVSHRGVITRGGNDVGGTCNHFSVWNPDRSVFDAVQDFLDAGSLNHWTTRANDVAALNNSGYGTSSGVYMATRDLANPATANIIWQPSPCDTSPDGSGNYVNPACNGGQFIDNHLSGVPDMASGTDNHPICGDTYNYDTALPVANTAYQGEVTCTQSANKWTNPATPAGTVWRGPHHFNTQTADLFNLRFVISQYSISGKYVGFTSDWNNTLGSDDGTTPTLGTTPAGSIASSATCYGGWNWQSNKAYTLGALIRPSTDLGGGGTLYPVYQAVVAGTSQTGNVLTVVPALFANHALGDTVTDGGVTWMQVAATANCAGDMFITEVAN